MSAVATAQGRLASARERYPVLDHLIRMVQHYGAVKGNLQAGAITYFGFISFFPILALGFAVIGYVSRVYSGATGDLVTAIDAILPGLIGEEKGQISLDAIAASAPGILSVGLIVVLYSGLGWLTSLREALIVMFELPQRKAPNFVIGKLRDVAALVLLGTVLVLSVGVAGVVRGLSAQILDWLNLGAEFGWALGLAAVVLGMVANAVLFAAMFKILANPGLPRRALWSGAILGAIGFEILKQLSQFLLASTKEAEAFQAFGIALILVVWIYYLSRLVMYAAAWAHTHPLARAQRPDRGGAVQGPASPPLEWRAEQATVPGRKWSVPFAAGGAAMLGLIALVRKRPAKRD